MSPTVSRERTIPVTVVRSVNSATALVVAAAWSSGEGYTTSTPLVVLIQKVLLGGGAEGGVESDVVVDTARRCLETVRRRALQRAAEAWTVHVIAIQSSEAVAHGAQLGNDLLGQTSRDAIRVAAAGDGAAQCASSASAHTALQIAWPTAVAGDGRASASTSLLACAFIKVKSNQIKTCEQNIGKLLPEP